MNSTRHISVTPAPTVTILSLVLFLFAVSQYNHEEVQQKEQPPAIVISTFNEVLLYAGDRFLAADIDAIRAVAASTSQDAETFRLNAHLNVSRLNPCHEDNYWIGNAVLSWGGSEKQGFEVLRHAIRCRFWDEWPAFFYGFNQYFFSNNIPEARLGLSLAADRTTSNRAMHRTFSIMLAAGQINDIQAAIKMIRNERNQAKDQKLRDLLSRRIIRLEGLEILRNAKKAYEERFSRPLDNPQELIKHGLLDKFPDDPLNIGYEFRDHTFHLRQIQIGQ